MLRVVACMSTYRRMHVNKLEISTRVNKKFIDVNIQKNARQHTEEFISTYANACQHGKKACQPLDLSLNAFVGDFLQFI